MTRQGFSEGDSRPKSAAGRTRSGFGAIRALVVSHVGWHVLVTMASVIAVVGIGLLLGRALTSPNWTRVVPWVGLPAFGLLLFLSPRAGLAVWVVLAPFASHLHLKLDLGSGIPNLDITRVATLILLFQLVSGVILRANRKPHLTWTDVAMLLYIGAMTLSLLGSQLGLLSGVQTIFDFVAIPLLGYWFARHWLRRRGDLVWTVAAVALVGTLLGIITVREQLTGQALFSPVAYSLIYEGRIRKVLSVFGSPAAMTTALSVGVPFLLLGIRQAAGQQRRLILGLALIAMLAGIFFAYVRAGWLGVVVGIVVLLWLSPAVRRALAPLLPVVALVVIVLMAVAVINPQTVGGRLTSEEPISYRLTAWRIAWEIFRSSPVLGVGYGQFGVVAAQQFGWNPFVRLADMPSPHNSYLDVLVQGGLLAALPYFAVFAGLAWNGWLYWTRVESGERAGEHRELVATLWATLLGYTVTIGTFDVLNSQFANILFFLIMGALSGRLVGRSEAAR